MTSTITLDGTTKVSVLIIDDNPADIHIIKKSILNVNSGCYLMQALSGPDAMELLEQMSTGKLPRPSFILLDINMPKINGFDILKFIRQNETLKYIPVVICSSSSNRKDIDTAYMNGASAFITKAFKLPDYITAIQETYKYWTLVNMH